MHTAALTAHARAQKLYTYPGNPNAVKAMVAAEFVGVTIDVPPFAFGVDNKTPEFLKMNPNGKVPVLETPEGCIFESNAIARYIARLRPDVGLYGRTFIQSVSARARARVLFSDCMPAPPAAAMVATHALTSPACLPRARDRAKWMLGWTGAPTSCPCP